jgi:hypothetical protein
MIRLRSWSRVSSGSDACPESFIEDSDLSMPVVAFKEGEALVTGGLGSFSPGSAFTGELNGIPKASVNARAKIASPSSSGILSNLTPPRVIVSRYSFESVSSAGPVSGR